MNSLSFLSLMAANADPFYQQLVAYVEAQTDLSITVHDTLPWQARQRKIEDGAVDIAAICGAVYVRLFADANTPVQLLAAPLMRGSRYRNLPVYFSDVVVRRDSAYQQFADLPGAAWAYNEPGSFSGYHVVCAHLAEIGEDARYFASYLECGSHQEALRQVITGAADAAAIDSIVLRRALQLDPTLGDAIRTVASIGPNPVPPLVASRRLSAAAVEAIRTALLTMHTDAVGHELLHRFGIARFVPIVDRDYDPIRQQLARARSIQFVPTRRI